MSLVHRLRRFLADDSGPTAVEYAVMMALIILVCFAAVRNVGSSTSTLFNNAASSMGTAS